MLVHECVDEQLVLLVLVEVVHTDLLHFPLTQDAMGSAS